MRLYIVEDDLVLLRSLEILFGGEGAIEIVGSATRAEDALDKLGSIEAEILLTDLSLPGMKGIELICEVSQKLPGLLIIVHTISEENQTVFDAICAGASGYMLKGSSPRELIEALAELYEGGAPMSPRIAKKVIKTFQQNNTSSMESLLSTRELEVLKLIEQGLSYTECASHLCISRHTVNSHIKKIYHKLHASNKAEALLFAKQKGIL